MAHTVRARLSAHAFSSQLGMENGPMEMVGLKNSKEKCKLFITMY